MAELYVVPSFEKAIEIGTKVFEYGTTKGPTDVHTVDAVLELAQHVQALLRKHVDELQKFTVVPPASEAEFVKNMGEACEFAKNLRMGDGLDLGTLLKLSSLIKWFVDNVLSKILNK